MERKKLIKLIEESSLCHLCLSNVNEADKEIKELVANILDALNHKRFIKPELSEIVDYCKEKNLQIDPQVFYDHYQSNGWKIGKTPMKDWRAAARNWSRRRQPNVDKGSSAYREFKTDEDFKRFGL